MNLDRIALQLYTVRQEAAQDFLGTLRRVAEIGYPAVEFAGFGGVPVPELRATLDELGLRAMGAHVPIANFETRLPDVLADLRTLGCSYAVVPWLPPERRGDDQLPELCALFNRLGAACREAGLVFAYHNHDFEFAPLDGAPGRQTFFDVLVAETDPDLVGFELDVYWAAYAGLDPIQLLRHLGRRVPLVHLKDMAPGADRGIAAFGVGTLPWPEILAAATDAGVAWGIVEQDNPRDAFADARTGLESARRLLARSR